MKGLPDAFPANVIPRGAPAEGLPRGTPACGASLSEVQIRGVILSGRALAPPPFRAAAVLPIVAPPRAPTQPIFFSHLIHAGKYQIDCQYCHADARRS